MGQNVNLPSVTRLRFVKAKDPLQLVEWVSGLGVRIQIYGSPVFDGSSWFVWFVPDDFGSDILSIDLDE